MTRVSSLQSAVILAAVLLTLPQRHATAQLTQNERRASVGDSPPDPGQIAKLSYRLDSESVRAAMRKVGNWQNARIVNTPSQDWTFATLYIGLLAASKTLHEPSYHQTVLSAAESFQWSLGPRQTHADDQATGQVYLELYEEHPLPARIAPLQAQFDRIMKLPDDPAKPVWWWCDALFMAPPVWAGLSHVTHDPKYLDYMDHEWHVTYDQLWNTQEHLFARDASYLDKYEKNGRKVFWSRGNGWVMGGIVRVLQQMPSNDPRRTFYVTRLQEMAAAVAAAQGQDGLWRAGLLDPSAYPNPEISGSAFFVYAITWGIHHKILNKATYAPVVERAWSGMLQHVYSDGRLGDIQPVGEAPGAYSPGASYVYGVGAFLLAGSELDALLLSAPNSLNLPAR